VLRAARIRERNTTLQNLQDSSPHFYGYPRGPCNGECGRRGVMCSVVRCQCRINLGAYAGSRFMDTPGRATLVAQHLLPDGEDDLGGFGLGRRSRRRRSMACRSFRHACIRATCESSPRGEGEVCLATKGHALSGWMLHTVQHLLPHASRQQEVRTFQAAWCRSGSVLTAWSGV